MSSLPKKILSFLVEDIPAKIFIILFSTVLWFFVNVLAVEVVSINLPVGIENPPEDAALVPIDRMNVQVNLRSRMDITAQTNQIKAYIDLAKAKRGEAFHPVHLTGVPEGVFSSVLPYSLRVDTDNYIEKSLPLVLNVVGGDEKNHVLDYRWTPGSVVVRGPSRIFRRLKEIESEPLDIRRINKTQADITLKLNAPPFCSLAQSNAQLSLNLAIERYTNLVEVPLTLSNLPEDKNIIPLPLIPVEIISRTSNKQILKGRVTASADIEGLEEGRHTVPLMVQSQDEIGTNTPSFVEIKISKQIR